MFIVRTIFVENNTILIYNFKITTKQSYFLIYVNDSLCIACYDIKKIFIYYL